MTCKPYSFATYRAFVDRADFRDRLAQRPHLLHVYRTPDALAGALFAANAVAAAGGYGDAAADRRTNRAHELDLVYADLDTALERILDGLRGLPLSELKAREVRRELEAIQLEDWSG